jgi:hypothetical protein
MRQIFRLAKMAQDCAIGNRKAQHLQNYKLGFQKILTANGQIFGAFFLPAESCCAAPVPAAPLT